MGWFFHKRFLLKALSGFSIAAFFVGLLLTICAVTRLSPSLVFAATDPSSDPGPVLSSPEDARETPILCRYNGVSYRIGQRCGEPVAEECKTTELTCTASADGLSASCVSSSQDLPPGTVCGSRANCCWPSPGCDGRGACSNGSPVACPPPNADPCVDYSCAPVASCAGSAAGSCSGVRNLTRCPDTCTCGYSLPANLADGAARCSAACTAINGGTAPSYSANGSCLCSGMPLQPCPDNASGYFFNAAGTFPAVCVPPSQDCVVSDWEPAAIPCGQTITQTRRILQYPVGSGSACPALQQQVTGNPCQCENPPTLSCSLDDPNGGSNTYVFCSGGGYEVWDDKLVRPNDSPRCAGQSGSTYYSCMMRSLAADLCQRSTGASSHTVVSFSGAGTVSGTYQCENYPLSNPADCKKDCVVSGWTGPPVPCNGTYISSPIVSQQPAFGGAACPGSRSEQCSSQPCACSYAAPALSADVVRGDPDCGCVPADGTCKADQNGNVSEDNCSCENTVPVVTSNTSSTQTPAPGDSPYSCSCRWMNPEHGDVARPTACSYKAQAIRKSRTTAYCTAVCASIGATGSSHEVAGYCVCSGVTGSRCPSSAEGAPWVVIGTAPGSCAPNTNAPNDPVKCPGISCSGTKSRLDTSTCSCQCPLSCPEGQGQDPNTCACVTTCPGGESPAASTDPRCCEKAIHSCNTPPRLCTFTMSCFPTVLRFSSDDECKPCRGEQPDSTEFNTLAPLVGMQESCGYACPSGRDDCCPTAMPWPGTDYINNRCEDPMLGGPPNSCQIRGNAQMKVVCKADLQRAGEACKATFDNYPYPTGGGTCQATKVKTVNPNADNGTCSFIEGTTNQVRCTQKWAVQCVR